jgi:hypothetical protein
MDFGLSGTDPAQTESLRLFYKNNLVLATLRRCSARSRLFKLTNTHENRSLRPPSPFAALLFKNPRKNLFRKISEVWENQRYLHLLLVRQCNCRWHCESN